MEFILAGSNNQNIPVFKPLIPKVFDTVSHIKQIKQKISNLCGWLWNQKNQNKKFESFNSPQTNSFVPLFTEQSHQTTFQPFPTINTGTFEKISIPKFHAVPSTPTIDVNKLKQTSCKIRKISLKTPYKTQYFDSNWQGWAILEKWTLINFDTTKPICSFFDIKTQKNQAYVAISSIIHQDDTSGNTLENISGWYIRAAWLDGIIQRKNNKITQPTTNTKKPISFAGYYSPKSTLIPEKYVQQATQQYLWKNILPTILANITLLDKEIATTRSEITMEVLGKNIPFSQTSCYLQHMKNLEKKKSWKRLEQSIQSITLNQQEMDPILSNYIGLLQSKPKWQEILQEAAKIDWNAKIRRKY